MLLKGRHIEVLLDRIHFYGNRLPLQSRERMDGVVHHQGVVASGVVGDQDHLERHLLHDRRDGIDQRLAVGVYATGRQRLDRGHIAWKPHQPHMRPVFLQIAVVLRHIPRHPPRPIRQPERDTRAGLRHETQLRADHETRGHQKLLHRVHIIPSQFLPKPKKTRDGNMLPPGFLSLRVPRTSRGGFSRTEHRTRLEP